MTELSRFENAAPQATLLKTNLSLMRSRCRDRVRNDDYAKGYVNMVVSNVIGPDGIRLQSNATGPSGKRDELAIVAIEKAWKNWGKYPDNVDITGRDNWKQILKQLATIYGTDGEIFIRHIPGNEAGDYGYSIEVIDPACPSVIVQPCVSPILKPIAPCHSLAVNIVASVGVFI